MNEFLIRGAALQEAEEIYSFVKKFSASFNLLPVSLPFITANIDCFSVVSHEKKIIGICSLFIYNQNLAEIRSLGVIKEKRNNGLGRKLINSILDLAFKKKIKKVFALTKANNFFLNMGFRAIPKEKLPEKIFKDCASCPSFPHCQEEAFIIDYPFRR